MNLTIDEYLAVLQSDEEGREVINNKISEQAKRRYADRFKGNAIYRSPEIDVSQINEQKEILDNMEPQEFLHNRMFQIYQLYTAYIAKEHSRRIMPGATDEKSVRRVVGPYAGRGIVYSGNLFLDYNTIQAVESISKIMLKNNRYGPESPDGISIIQISKMVDEMLACHEILNEGRNKEISMQTMIKETDAAKRVIGRCLEYNVYGIQDFSTTAEEMYASKRSVIAKVIEFFKGKKVPEKLGDMPINEVLPEK